MIFDDTGDGGRGSTLHVARCSGENDDRSLSFARSDTRNRLYSGQCGHCGMIH